MSDDSPKLQPLPCAQCGRPPVVGYELPGGVKINLCLEHYQQFNEQRLREIELCQRGAEQAEDDLADIVGFPRKQRPAPVSTQTVHLRQVNIHGDNLGVVNTGTAGNVTNNLSIIRGCDAALAERIEALTVAIRESSRLNAVQKQEATELLAEVVDDVAKPPQEKRPRTVMKSIAAGLGQVLSHAADVYTLWTAIEPHLK